MKKTLLVLLLILSLLLSSCGADLSDPGDSSGTVDSGDTSQDPSGSPSEDTDDAPAQDGSGDSAECSSHVDNDESGRCDRCYASVIVTFDFYTLNDFHGKFFDSDSQYGVDEMTTYLKTVAEKDEHPILMSSGDMWQGSAESTATRGAIITDWMNALGFVSMTLGNHEYDWGEELIEENAQIADFPLLAINVYDKSTNQRVEYAESSIIVERGGVKIGIIGAMGDCYSSIMSSMVEDVYFKTGKELSQLVKEESRRLRSEGVQIIVYSLHDGFDSSSYNNKIIPNSKLGYYDHTLSSGGFVDLVFEAHTHQKYVMKDTYGIYHLQGGGDNEGLTHAEMVFNTVTSGKRINDAAFVSGSVYSSMDDDPLIEQLSDKYSSELGEIFKPLGKNAYNKSGDYMRSLVARLYLELGERVFSEYDIVLGGGFISIRDPYYLPAGDVSYSDLSMLFPFDNQIVLCSVSGKSLKEKFIETNNSNYYVAYGEYGEQIKSKIDTDATYYIIVDTYTAQYAPNNLTIVEEYLPGVYARDLIAEYIRSGGLS